MTLHNKITRKPGNKKIEQIRKDYSSGKLLTGELKQHLIEKINKFLEEHQAKRRQAAKQLEKFIYK